MTIISLLLPLLSEVSSFGLAVNLRIILHYSRMYIIYFEGLFAINLNLVPRVSLLWGWEVKDPGKDFGLSSKMDLQLSCSPCKIICLCLLKRSGPAQNLIQSNFFGIFLPPSMLRSPTWLSSRSRDTRQNSLWGPFL